MTTATQTGVDKPKKSSREEMLNKLNSDRVEELNAELKKGGSEEQIEFTPMPGADPDDDDPDDAAAEKERLRLAAEAKAAEEAARAAPAKGDEDPIYEFLGEDRLDKTKVKIKVDGTEQEVVLGDVLRGEQKLRTADKRLEEASIARKEATDIKARAEAEAAEITKRAAEEAAAAKEKQEAPSALAGLTEAVNLIYEGEQAKGAEALAKAVSEEVERRVKAATPGATVDAQAIADDVHSRVSWSGALEHFSANHQDIVSEIQDEDLRMLWESKLAQAGRASRSYAEALGKAAELYRAAVPAREKPSGERVGADDEALRKRETEKAAAAARSVRSSTGQRAPGARQEQQPQTPSDIIAEMKKLRGQA